MTTIMNLLKSSGVLPPPPPLSSSSAAAAASSSPEASFDCISAIGLCGILGYEAEVNHCIGLCTDARTDFHLLTSLSSVYTYVYQTKQKHRIQYACLRANLEWFRTLLKVANHNDILYLRTVHNENLYHLLNGYFRVVTRKNYFDVFPRTNDEPFFAVNPMMSPYLCFVPCVPQRTPVAVQIFNLLTDLKTDSSINDIINDTIKVTNPEKIRIPRPTDPPTEDSRRDQYTSVMLAVAYSHNELLRTMIKHYPDQIDGQSLLPLAYNAGNREAVPWICTLPSVVRDAGDIVFTAARDGYTEVFYELAKYPNCYQPNQQNKIGLTPLHLACRYNHRDIVQHLCSLPTIDFDIVDQLGDTPFLFAIRHNNIEIVKELLKYRNAFDINRTDGNGRTPIGLALNENYNDIVTFLCTVEGLDIDILDSDGNNLLQAAILRGNLFMINELLNYRQRYTLFNRNRKGQTVLHMATERRLLPTLHQLFTIPGMTCDTVDNQDNTCLHIATTLSKTDALTEILKYRQTKDVIKLVNKDGNTCLHIAAMHENPEVLKELLKHREVMDVLNHPNGRGRTALWLACLYKRKENVKQLGAIKECDLEKPDNDPTLGPRKPSAVTDTTCKQILDMYITLRQR